MLPVDKNRNTAFAPSEAMASLTMTRGTDVDTGARNSDQTVSKTVLPVTAIQSLRRMNAGQPLQTHRWAQGHFGHRLEHHADDAVGAELAAAPAPRRLSADA